MIMIFETALPIYFATGAVCAMPSTTSSDTIHTKATMANPQSSEKKRQTKLVFGTGTDGLSSYQMKRARADAADSLVLKKARPSICKAAEELVCPILQGLPINPVMAADVSQEIYLCHCAHLSFTSVVCLLVCRIYFCVISGPDLRAGGDSEVSRTMEHVRRHLVPTKRTATRQR